MKYHNRRVIRLMKDFEFVNHIERVKVRELVLYYTDKYKQDYDVKSTIEIAIQITRGKL